MATACEPATPLLLSCCAGHTRQLQGHKAPSSCAAARLVALPSQVQPATTGDSGSGAGRHFDQHTGHTALDNNVSLIICVHGTAIPGLDEHAAWPWHPFVAAGALFDAILSTAAGYFSDWHQDSYCCCSHLLRLRPEQACKCAQ